ncbi:MAG TPA: TerB family tellurite resistance protein [Acidiferrobacteraceae bacterium]|nr:TerB family tellurite resistance protein [Acidiferrobacteraceae bacterium]
MTKTTMIRSIQQFFEVRLTSQTNVDPQSTDHRLQLATAALLIEMTRTDHDISEIEQQEVTDAIQSTFELDDEDTQNLIELAEQQAKQATSLFAFTNLINNGFNREEKNQVIELLWRVAYADQYLEKNEQHLMRRLANLLHISHKDYIAAKFRARELAGVGAET